MRDGTYTDNGVDWVFRAEENKKRANKRFALKLFRFFTDASQSYDIRSVQKRYRNYRIFLRTSELYLFQRIFALVLCIDPVKTFYFQTVRLFVGNVLESVTTDAFRPRRCP